MKLTKAGHFTKIPPMYLVGFLLCLINLISAAAIDECVDKSEPSEIPCMIVSSYHFEPDCVSTTAKVYNSDEFLEEFTFGDYLDSGLCNFTFNHTERGTYIINASEGSVRILKVEGYKMDFFNLSVFAFFFLLSIVFIFLMHTTSKDNAGSSIVYGMFSSVLLFIMGGIIASGFAVITTDVIIIFDLNYYLAAICFVLGIYTAIHSVMLYQYSKQSKSDFEVD